MSSISGIKMLINPQSHPCSSHYSRPFRDSPSTNQPRLYSTYTHTAGIFTSQYFTPNTQTKNPTLDTFTNLFHMLLSFSEVLFIAKGQLLLGIMSTQHIKLDHGHSTSGLSRGEKFSFRLLLLFFFFLIEPYM